LAFPQQLNAHVEILKEEKPMRRFLIIAALGLGVVSAGAATRPAEAAPMHSAHAGWGMHVTPVQYHHHHYRPYYAPRPHYVSPSYYGYYAPPPPMPYWRHHRHHYRHYGWR
jgi:hypothetical protein